MEFHDINQRSPMSICEILSKIEEDTTEMRWGHQRSKLFAEAAELYEKRGDHENIRKMGWEIVLFYLRPLDYDDTKKNGNRFAPMFEYTNGTISPDKKTFSKDQIEYYKMRAELSDNPIMTSRYSDIVWDLARDHVYARLAVEKYLECREIYLKNRWHNEVADSLTRAAGISLSLRDNEQIEKVRNVIIKTMRELAESKDYAFFPVLTDALLDMKKYSPAEKYETVIKIMKKGSLYYKNDVKDGYFLQRALLRKLVELKKVIKKVARAHRMEIAQSYEEEAEWKFENYPQGASVSAGIIQDAIKSYEELGELEKVKELKIKLKKRTGMSIAEMKTIAIPITIPSDEIDSFLSPLRDLNLIDSLNNIAGDDRLIPSIEIIRAQTEELKKIAPLSFIFTRVSIRDDNPVLTSESDEEIFEHHVKQNTATRYQIGSSIIGIAIESLIEKRGFNTENFISFLGSKGVYQEEPLKMISIGIERYLEEDYVSSIHVLIPQLETTLRQILGNIGEPTTKYRAGSVQERTLEDILRDPKLEEHLGEDICNYLRVFLVDKVGDNLRPDMAHGLLTVDMCTRNKVITIIHLLLVLTRFAP